MRLREPRGPIYTQALSSRKFETGSLETPRTGCHC